MGYLRIHCDYCGGTWEVYRIKGVCPDHGRICPHCGQKIDPEAWDTRVIPAFKRMNEANVDVNRIQNEYHGPNFMVDYIEDCFFPAASKGTRSQISRLDDKVEELRDAFSDLTETVAALMGGRKGTK